MVNIQAIFRTAYIQPCGRSQSFLLCFVIVSIICLSFAAGVSHGATYYVDDANGSDANNGSSWEESWKTIARAQNYKTGYIPNGYDPMVVSGDMVIVKNGSYGTYDEDNTNNPRLKWYIFRTDWITYKAAPGHTPILNNVVIRNEDVWNTPKVNGSSYLIFDGFRITDSAYLQFTSYFQVRNCTVTSPVESYEGFYAPYFPFNSAGISANGCKHIIVEDCDISRTYRGISVIDANDVTIRNNLIHYFGEDGITAPGCNITIDKNKIYDVNIYSTTIDIYGTGSGTFTAGDALTQAGTNATGIYVGKPSTQYMIYQTSAIPFKKQSDGGGTISGPTGTISTITYIDPQHNDAIAMHWLSMSNIVVTNNIIIGPQMKIATYNEGVLTNITIANNLFYASIPPIDDVSMYMATEPVGGSPVATWTNVNIYNNTFYSRKILVRNSVKIENFYNNILRLLMYEPEHGALIANHGNNIFTEDPGTFKNDTELVTSTPGFVNAANNDFNLAPNSAAINFGNPNYGPASDILGNSRNFPPDAGCYEYIPPDSNNHAPVLGVIINRSVNENTLLTFTVNATDPDGDTVTYSAPSLPTGATFSSQTFSWTPRYDQAGTYNVTFIARDEHGAQSSPQTVVITVNNVNRPPVLAAIGNKSVSENNALSFSVSATDPDGDTVTYSYSGLPVGASFSSQTFNWTPTYAQTGTYQVTFTAGDGQAQDSEIITITVNNVNRAPVLSSIGNKSVYVNDPLTFLVSATDPDGDTLGFSANALPSGATFASQSFNWQPVSTQVGSHQVTFVASDGELQDSETITITVFAADTAPPSVTNCSPAADSIQVPLNSLIILHITDAGKGVDAGSVAIKVNDNVIYSGDTLNYSSTYGNCHRSGTKADYTFVYQANAMFDFDRLVSVTANAADLAGNAMSQHSYSFRTEMQSLGQNKKVNTGSDTLTKAAPATVWDSAGNIWAAWHAGPAGSRDIYVGKLKAGADNFESSIRLTASSADQCNPAIAIGNDDKLYLAWQDNRIGTWDIYVTSFDGATWSTERRVTDSNDNQINPAVAVDNLNRAHIVWQDDRNGNQDIYIATSSNGFVTETVSQITSNIADQIAPAIAVDSSNTVYVVWTEARSGSSDIYGACSNSGPWTNVPIVNNAGNQSSPAIAAESEGSILHLLWVDDRSGNQDIYYATSNGLPSSPLSGSSIIDDTSAANQSMPVIVTSSSKVFACWQDQRNVATNGGDTDLYLTELTSGSRTNILVGDDGTNADQSEPAMGIGEYGHPYLVWTDDRSTNTEIYYAGSTFVEPVALTAKDVSASLGAVVGTEPASISSVDDVSVVVPPGACSCDVKITISKIKNPPVFAMQCLGSYDFGPSGMQFSQPVTITIPYSAAGSAALASAYWYNSLTGALSQQGITNVENLQISSTLYALRFKTTHFTFYVLSRGGDADAGGATGGGGGGGGGCSISAGGEGDIVEFLLPYIGLAIVMVILKLRDRQNRKSRNNIA